jgi:N12 class adenine-specific DNA methylase
MAMMDETLQLSHTDEQYLQDLKNTFAIIADNTYTQAEATKILQELYDQSQWSVYQLIKDSETLFTKIRSFNKDFHKIKMREWLTERRRKCSEPMEDIPEEEYSQMRESRLKELTQQDESKEEEDKRSEKELNSLLDLLPKKRQNPWFNPELAVKINEQLMKIDQMHVADPEGDFDYSTLIPGNINFTTDPKALLQDAEVD